MTTLKSQYLVLMVITVLGVFAYVGCTNNDIAGGQTVTLKAQPDLDDPNHNLAGHEHTDGENTADSTILDWCLEHAVPESECTRCNPGLIESYKQSGDWYDGHGVPESHCRLCNPEITFPQEETLKNRRLKEPEQEVQVSLYFRPNSQVCATDGALIQFASAMTAELAGITVQEVYSSQGESVIEAPAEVVFDETETYVVTSTVPALVSRWLVSPGDVVKKGSELAVLQSPEIALLKTSLITAHVNYDVERKELERHSELRRKNLISDAGFDQQTARTEQARAELVSARGLLLSAGLDDKDIDDVIEQGLVSNQFVLRAPSSGIVTERIAQLGELIDPGRAFAMLADPHSLWIEAKLTGEEMRTVEVGQALTFASDGRGLDRVGAEIIWKSHFLDTHTRTGIVRARVLDRTSQLRAGDFGRVKIVHPRQTKVVLVPKDAVQWEGCCNVVFVQETDQRYRPFKVQLQGGNGPYYQVTSGLVGGERVAVAGAFLLKTELKKSSLGAGCCAFEPAG